MCFCNAHVIVAAMRDRCTLFQAEVLATFPLVYWMTRAHPSASRFLVVQNSARKIRCLPTPGDVAVLQCRCLFQPAVLSARAASLLRQSESSERSLIMGVAQLQGDGKRAPVSAERTYPAGRPCPPPNRHAEPQATSESERISNVFTNLVPEPFLRPHTRSVNR